MRIVNTLVFVAILLSTVASGRQKDAGPAVESREILALEGGRRLDYLRAFSSESDIKTRPSIWKQVWDVVAGTPEYHRIVRPYSIVTDSHGRILVTDPGEMSVHVFDFDKKKYLHLDAGKHGEQFRSPIGIAVDGADNIYVADSVLGKIFVFDSRGKFRRYIGAISGMENFFKRPTGIAIDTQRGELFVSDTLRNKIFVMDLEGHSLRDFGGPGAAPGQFNFPTEVVVRGDEVFVVDAMNFRVQIFGRDGTIRSQIGVRGNSSGSIFRPKGLGLDSEGNIYLVDGLFETVQVFNRAGALLYYFGHTGGGAAEFELPSGLWIDKDDRIYVADSYNHRIQIFHLMNAQRTRSEKPQ